VRTPPRTSAFPNRQGQVPPRCFHGSSLIHPGNCSQNHAKVQKVYPKLIAVKTLKFAERLLQDYLKMERSRRSAWGCS
jgi:hypothetical protein